MNTAVVVLFFGLVALGLKWAMYNPHPPQPGVQWSACLLNAAFVVFLFLYAIKLHGDQAHVAASGVAAYASGELTGKGFNLFGASNPMNPQRSPTGEVSVWEEFWLGFGDVLFATAVVALPTVIVYWIFDLRPNFPPVFGRVLGFFALADMARSLFVHCRDGAGGEESQEIGRTDGLPRLCIPYWWRPQQQVKSCEKSKLK